MRISLVRHGEAAPAANDGERPLTAAGRAEVARLAEWCAANGVLPRQIRHSGILRAAQTAEILAARLEPPGGTIAVKGLAPDDDPSKWQHELPHETEDVLLVTHMPLVGEVAALLAGRRGAAPFAPGEIACFEPDGAVFRVVASWRP
jgi:phosphohistidine phosphatase